MANAQPAIVDEYMRVQAVEGSRIWIDEWDRAEVLIADDTEWDRCDFRISVHNGFYKLAVVIEVTGWKSRNFHREPAVRVRVIFPGDGEPDTICHGWMWLDRENQTVDDEAYDRYWEERDRKMEQERLDLERLQAELELRRLQEQEREEQAQKLINRAHWLEL